MIVAVLVMFASGGGGLIGNVFTAFGPSYMMINFIISWVVDDVHSFLV